MKLKNTFAKIKEWAVKVNQILTSNHFMALEIKYIPLIATALLCIHLTLLLVGVSEPITVGLSSILLVAMLILLSIRFGFCKLHKALIGYMGIMTICICLARLKAITPIITIVRVTMLLVGVALLIWAAIRGIKNDDCGK